MAVVLYTGASTSLLDTIRTEQKDDESIKLHSSSTGTSYVGLSNQGATCYLNSLLQTLFMTPEFRHAIFSWRYDQSKDTDQDHCIPLQLQKLFGYLAFGKNKSVDTVALTKSFGWEGSEVFQQQDVQELTRVLFDALEVSFKGTPLETIIDDIYAGELIDYIRCIDVDSQRERMDKFLDLSFAIVPFGQTKAMHSLSECIEMFLRPEMLDGDNQYYAEQFQKKVDAIKGLKFGKLPQIMSCNLKRFVYDFSGSYVSQKKINDVVKFPFILDMNRYVCKRKAGKHRNEVTRQHEHKPPQSSSTHDDEQCESVADLADEYEPNEEFERFLLQRMTELRTGAQADKDMTQVDDDEGKTNGTRTPPTVASDSVYHTPVRSGKVIIENNKTSEVVEPAASSSSSSAIPKVPDFSTMPDLVDEVGGLCPEQRQEQLETRMLSPNWSPDEIQALIRERGEWVYELFAVLIHAGAISGGHYYAYIKNLDDHEWYNFNDSTVTHISAEQVAEAWGGETTYTTSSYNSTYYYPTYPSPTTTTTMSTANAYMLMYRKVQVNPHHSHDSQTNEQDAGDDTDMMRNTKQQSVVSTSFPSTDSVPEYILEDVRQAEIRQEEKLREQEELRNKLELKVWWKGAERVVTTSREQLYKDFLLHLWSFLELHKEPEFDLTDSVAVADSTTNSSETSSASDEMVSQWPPINRMRLRLYSYYKTGADTFDYEEFANSSLEKMNIGAYRPLLLETRRVTEQFEVYYLNGFNLEVDEFDRDTGKYNPVKKFRFPLGTTCTEFYERLSQSFGYPLGSFRVFKCSKNAYCDAKVHFIPQTSSQRISEDLLMSEYIKIGLERFDPAVESIDDTESSPAAIAYLDERNQISLRYNVYPSRDEIQLVQADFRWTVANLRARIAELCNLPVDETRLIRNSSAGAELKDDSVRLVDTNIYDKMTIYVQSGKALPEGYYNLCFSLFKPTEYKAGVQFLPANLNNYATVEDGMKDSSSIGDNMELASGVTAQSSSSKPAQPSCLWYSRRDSDYMDADSTIGRGTKRSSGTADHGVKRYVPADGSDVVFERPNGAWEASFETELDSIPSDQSVDITIPERAPTPLDTCMSTIAPSSSAASLPIIDEDEEMRVLYAKDGGTDEVAVEMSVFDRVVDVDPWDVIDAMGQEQRPCTPEIEDAPNQLSPNKSSSRACRVHSDTELAAQFDSLKTDLNTVIEAEVNANDFAERKTTVSMDARQFENLSELESVPVSNDTLLDDLKAQILDKLVAAGKVPVETAPRQLRLRSFIYNRADSFLKNNERPITECGVPLYDGRQLCVQVLDEPENLSLDNVNDVVVLVQRWHRSTWTLGECREVCLRNDMPLRDIATGLGEMMSIEPRNMRVLVVRNHSDVRLRYLNMATPRLSLESWLDPYSESPTRTLAQAKRLFFSDLLLIQDVTEPLYELTPSDKLSIQLVDLTENSYGNARSYQSYDGYDSLYSTQNGCELSLVSPSATRSGGGIKIKIHSRQSSVVDEKPNEISKDDTETTEGVNNNDNNHINPLFNDL